MNEYLFSLDLTLYCKIRNSPAFGGVGSVGYCTLLIDDLQDGEDGEDTIGEAIFRQSHLAQREMMEDFEITLDDFELLSKAQFLYESGLTEDDLDDEDDQTSLFDEIENEEGVK